MVEKKTNSDKAAHLREQAEALARGKAAHLPEDFAVQSPEETRRTLHELHVHQIELEMQNEELRKTQAELELQRERYFDLYNLAPVGYLTLNEKGLILDANLTAARLLGMARSKLVGQPLSRFILKEDQDSYYFHRNQLFRERHIVRAEIPRDFELRLLKHESLPASVMGKGKDGTAFWAHLAATTVQDADGAPVCRITLSDITERKKAEERNGNERDLLRICHFAIDTPELMRELIGYFKQMTGIEAVGVRLHQGEDFPYYETTGFSNEFVMAERSLCAKDFRGGLLRDSSGNPVLECMCGNIICGRFDPSRPFFTKHGSFWSSCTTQLLATTTEADRQARTRNRCNGEGYESVALIPLNSQGKTYGLFQFNDRRPGCFKAERIEQLEHLVDYVALALANLESARALHESEKRYHSFVENAYDIIYTVGLDGILTFVSSNWTALLGHDVNEVIGLSFEAFVHPDDIPACRAFVEQIIIRGEKVAGIEYRVHHKNGSWRWHTSNGSPLQEMDGHVYALVGIARDITERKFMDDTLQASLNEKDVLLREVHHRVKNNLAAILGLLDMERHATRDPLADALLVGLSNRIKSMATVHEKLYRSENLSKIDFQDYLKSFTSHLRTSYPVKNEVVCRVDAAGTELGLDIAVPCGLIVNELVTNALKYAFPQGKPGVPGEVQCEIGIFMSVHDSDYTLMVTDNGVGIPQDVNWRKTKTMGLRLVRMLGEHQLGGRVDLDRSRGTLVTIRFNPGKRTEL